MNNYFS
jgi:hypothetical protein